MTTILIILGIWLAPGLTAYIIASAMSKDWRVTNDDALLLVPVVNLVMLGLVVMISIGDWLDGMFGEV